MINGCTFLLYWHKHSSEFTQTQQGCAEHEGCGMIKLGYTPPHHPPPNSPHTTPSGPHDWGSPNECAVKKEIPTKLYTFLYSVFILVDVRWVFFMYGFSFRELRVLLFLLLCDSSNKWQLKLKKPKESSCFNEVWLIVLVFFGIFFSLCSSKEVILDVQSVSVAWQPLLCS